MEDEMLQLIIRHFNDLRNNMCPSQEVKYKH
jgi:hypothetical protein